MLIYEVSNRDTWEREYILGEEGALSNRFFKGYSRGVTVEALEQITYEEFDNTIALINKEVHGLYSGYYFAHWDEIEYDDYLGNYDVIYQVGETVLFLKEW